MKLSWSKTFKKWFSIRSKAEDFEADDSVHGGDSDNSHVLFPSVGNKVLRNCRAELPIGSLYWVLGFY